MIVGYKNIEEFLVAPIRMCAKWQMNYQAVLIQCLEGRGVSMSEAKDIARQKQLQQLSFIPSTELGKNTVTDTYFDPQSIKSVPKNSVGLMKIHGVISQRGGMSSKGLEDYAQELKILGESDQIKGVLLEIDSGGGSAFGGEEFASIVGSFEKDYKKPIAAIVRNIAASAAYEIIAKVPKIFLSGEGTEVGSIGTMVTLTDYKGMLEDRGLKEIVVRASNSFNKNDEYYEAMQGNTDPLRENILDPLNKVFENIVRSGRRGKLNLSKKVNGVPEVLTGKVYFGKDAIEMGLADEIGTIKDAVKYLDKQSKVMQRHHKDEEDKKRKKTMEDYLTMSLSELEQKQQQEAQSNALQSVINLKKAEAEVIELKQQLSSSKDELKQSSQQLEELKQSVGTSNAKIEQLEKKLVEQKEQNAALEQNLEEVKQENLKLTEENGKQKDFIQAKFSTKQVGEFYDKKQQGAVQPSAKQEVKHMNKWQKRAHARAVAKRILEQKNK